MNKFVAIFSLLFAVLLSACGTPQDHGKGSAPQELIKGMEAHNRGDFPTALQEIRPLAERGDAHAQFLLGYMYGHGEGVPQDDAEAAKWYRKAAEQGHDSAQNNLGYLYEYGLGVPPDDTEAEKWYRKAAAQGNENAQRNLLMVGRSFSDRVVQDVLRQAERAR